MAIFQKAIKHAAVGAVGGFLFGIVTGLVSAAAAPTEETVPDIDEIKGRLYDVFPRRTAAVVDLLYKLHALSEDEVEVGIDTPQLAFEYKNTIETTLSTALDTIATPPDEKVVELIKEIIEYAHGLATNVTLDASSTLGKNIM